MPHSVDFDHTAVTELPCVADMFFTCQWLVLQLRWEISCTDSGAELRPFDPADKANPELHLQCIR